MSGASPTPAPSPAVGGAAAGAFPSFGPAGAGAAIDPSVQSAPAEDSKSLFHMGNLGAIGGLFGDMQDIKNVDDDYDTKLAILNSNIKRTRSAGKLAYARKRRQARKETGRQIAAVGASGIQMQGSALHALRESMREGEYEARMTKYDYDLQVHQSKLQKLELKKRQDIETGSGSKMMAVGRMLGGLTLA